MKSTELFLLGRRLMKLGEQGLPGQGVNNSVRLVLLDIAANPGSSISEIKARTAYPQSHVSTSVIKLRQIRCRADRNRSRATGAAPLCGSCPRLSNKRTTASPPRPTPHWAGPR